MSYTFAGKMALGVDVEIIEKEVHAHMYVYE